MQNIVLVLICILSLSSFANDLDLGFQEFSKSKEWTKLLFYHQGKSLVTSDRFFLSEKGRNNSYLELTETIKFFQGKRVNAEGVHYQCVFRARANLILRQWPGLFEKIHCQEFEEFKNGLDAGDLYLVYSSAYPNNPASMFGHTFLRFDRKKRGDSSKDKTMLGYSLSFQAQTDSADDPFTYTFKGLFGGYPAFMEIKPHYINLGVYNNLESRDLWEYPISLNQSEKDYLIDVLWEISQTVYFDYYFFDQNCSTYLLYVLEVIKPSLDFHTKENFFVVPQETLIEVLDNLPEEKVNFTPSIKRKIVGQYEKLSKTQKNTLFAAKENMSTLKSTQETKVLDTLIDYWKFQNYKEKLQLSKNDSDLMHETFKQRAKISTSSYFQFDDSEIIGNENPKTAHARHLLGLYGSNNEQRVRFKYGFHHWFDPERGRDLNSYINFLDMNYYFQSNNYFFDILDLLSLQNYNSLISSWSWRVKINSAKVNDNLSQSASGAFGFGNKVNAFQWFSLVAAKSYHYKKKSYIIPKLNLGFKYHLSGFRLIADYFGNFQSSEIKETDELKFQVKRDFNSGSLSISSQLFQGFSQSSLGVEYYFD